MKKFYLILSIIVLVPIGLLAQNDIEYIYDENGNRIERRLLDMGKKSLAETDSSFVDELSLKEKLMVEENIGTTHISFFPNPVSKILNIEIGGTEIPQLGDYILFNNNGKELMQGSLQNQTKIDLGEYPPGFYLIQLEIDSRKETWKIIKR
jgi:YD repeat-containing protein